jgi:hypothetical protein
LNLKQHRRTSLRLAVCAALAEPKCSARKTKTKKNLIFARVPSGQAKIGEAHDQSLVLGSFTAAILPSQIQATDCSSLNQAIGDCVEMDTEASNNNSQPNQEDDDRPLFGDFDSPFEETFARCRANSAKWTLKGKIQTYVSVSRRFECIGQDQ